MQTNDGHSGDRIAGSRKPEGYLLAVLAGPVAGEELRVQGLDLDIGSDRRCAISLPGLEPVQARLVRQGLEYDLVTVGAAGSVMAAGRSSGRVRLRAGDLIRVGDHVLRFVRAGEDFKRTFTEQELFERRGGWVQWLAFGGGILLLGALASAAWVELENRAHEEREPARSQEVPNSEPAPTPAVRAQKRPTIGAAVTAGQGSGGIVEVPLVQPTGQPARARTPEAAASFAAIVRRDGAPLPHRTKAKSPLGTDDVAGRANMLVQAGVILLQAGRSAEASVKFEEALGIAPGHEEAHRWLKRAQQGEAVVVPATGGGSIGAPTVPVIKYRDAQGRLHYVDHLDKVPPHLRSSAVVEGGEASR